MVYSQSISELAKQETNDCFVRSMAVAANLAYTEAHNLVKTLFDRKDKEGTFGVDIKLRDKQIRNTLLHKGIEVEAVNHTYYNKRSKRVLPLNVRGFYKKYNRGTYLVTTSKHAFVIKDGEIHDWEGKVPHIGRTILSGYRVKDCRQLELF